MIRAPSLKGRNPRLVTANSHDSSNISSTNHVTQNSVISSTLLNKSDRQSKAKADAQTRISDAKIKANKAKQKWQTTKSLNVVPNPARKIIPNNGNPANSQGKDVYTKHPGSQERVFTVTTLEDHDDGICDNDCSLREAIYAANNLPGADVIIFAVNGTIYLKLRFLILLIRLD